MYEFKIRCSGALHRITFDGKRWSTPDHQDADTVLSALSESQNKCEAFMRLVREPLPPGLVLGGLRNLGISNGTLATLLIWHKEIRSVKAARRRELKREKPRDTLSRWEEVIQRRILGWAPGFLETFGVIPQVLIDKPGDVLYLSNDYKLHIGESLAKITTYEPFYYKRGVFYYPTKEGYREYTLERGRGETFFVCTPSGIIKSIGSKLTEDFERSVIGYLLNAGFGKRLAFLNIYNDSYAVFRYVDGKFATTNKLVEVLRGALNKLDDRERELVVRQLVKKQPGIQQFPAFRSMVEPERR